MLVKVSAWYTYACRDCVLHCVGIQQLQCLTLGLADEDLDIIMVRRQALR